MCGIRIGEPDGLARPAGPRPRRSRPARRVAKAGTLRPAPRRLAQQAGHVAADRRCPSKRQPWYGHAMRPGRVDGAERERRVAVRAAVEQRRRAPVVGRGTAPAGGRRSCARSARPASSSPRRDRVPAVAHERDGPAAGRSGRVLERVAVGVMRGSAPRSAAARRRAPAAATPAKRSTSTSACCPEQPCASREVPTSRVSTFGLPCTHIASSARADRPGSNQAPVESCTTPGRTSVVSTAPARQLPRSLNSRTTSPSAMPRAAASAGCIRTGSRPLHLRRPGCRRRGRAGRAAASPGLFATSASGKRRARGEPSHSSLSSQRGMAGAVVVAEAARRSRRRARSCRSACCSGFALGIGAEGVEQHALGFEVRDLERARAPRTSSKVGRRDAGVARALRGSCAYRCSSQPRSSRPSVKASRDAEALGEPGEDVVVVRAPRRPARPRGASRRSARRRARSRCRCARSDVVAGKTRSAWRAIGVQYGSCTMTVSGRPSARRSRFRSWWWWNGLPPAQYTRRMSG